METLAQFLLRLAFGLALAMAITSPRRVSSGFFRNHLYVALGLATLAALVTYAASSGAFWFAVSAAAVSYVGSVCWLYEKPAAGRAALLVVALLALAGCFELTAGEQVPDATYARYFPPIEHEITAAEADLLSAAARRMGYIAGALVFIDTFSSGLLLGTVIAAMFLGHWYLNSPTMELSPLRRLLLAIAAALVLRAAVSGVGLACEAIYATYFATHAILFVLLRWSFGIFGVAALTWMTWRTLDIPNTQSATGILYVAVIGVFVGELTSMLLSAESLFPL